MSAHFKQIKQMLSGQIFHLSWWMCLLCCKLGTSSDFLESYFLLSYNTYCGFIDTVFLVMLLEHL